MKTLKTLKAVAEHQKAMTQASQRLWFLDNLIRKERLAEGRLRAPYLSERQHEVLSRHFGIDGFSETPQEIAESLGLTTSGVRAIIGAASRRLLKQARLRAERGKPGAP